MDYKKAYLKLFNEITKKIQMLDVIVFSLKDIQCRTEQMIIADESNEEYEEGGL
ncbi:MAG: hypothetical protein LBC86_09870 [Oscillospiraceae bacterium]|jgi:hypothetical protein|nr:hypothetical protein [Oscillospiraceae bacterium]